MLNFGVSIEPVLCPFEVLHLFRPLTLGAACRIFNSDDRRIKALKLIQHFFPERLWDVLSEDEWVSILRHFLQLVKKQNWFELDWTSMDDAYRWAQEETPETEEDQNNPDWLPQGLEYLSMTLDFIPIKCYGFSDDGWHNDITEHPPLELLKILLGPGGHEVSSGLIAKLGDSDLLPDDWDEEDKDEACWRLETLDASSLPEPLAWLPEMARYACGETGNIFLDKYPDWEDWTEGWFRWDNSNHLELLRQEWVEAQSALARIEVFEILTNNRESLRFILELLTR
ncbi:MAG: hypothetical protein DPW09_30895 [Anaerolineae bacterium]|nr:hypothetical protein [Anaerolineae bacterium]MCQ3977857.1 hypothetical protein [Anaerolineae bacterium]